MEDRRTGSAGRGFVWTLLLSILLGWIPVLGPFIAGFAGGRVARFPLRAFLIAIVPAAAWAAGLWFLSGHELKLAGQYVVVGPLALLAPVQAASFLGGALLGSSSGVGRLIGLAMLAIGLGYGIPKGREIAKVVSDLLAASHVQTYQPEKNKTCPENLKELYKAIQFYTDDWDGGLPPADRWVVLIKDKVPRDEWLHCPAVGRFGYSMNPALGGKKLASISERATTPLLYDSTDLSENAHAGPDSMPHPGRHMGRNNVLYADGTLKQK